jgi:hypothetical protein
MPRRVLIMGAAGRDFHNFNVVYRGDRQVEVVAFTATQIPFIDDRSYPASLAGEGYPHGIPIHDESELTQLVKQREIDDVIFSYSDVSHAYVMHKPAKYWRPARTSSCSGRARRCCGRPCRWWPYAPSARARARARRREPSLTR